MDIRGLGRFLACVLCFGPLAALAQGADQPAAPEETATDGADDSGLRGNLGLTLSYNTQRGGLVGMDVAARHLFGGDHELRFSTEVTQDDRRMGLSFTSKSLFGGNPVLSIKALHYETDPTRLFRFETSTDLVEPRLSWALGDTGRISTYLSFSRSRLDHLLPDPSVLILPDAGERDRSAVGGEYSQSFGGAAAPLRLQLGQEFGVVGDGQSYRKSTIGLTLTSRPASGAVVLSAQMRAGLLGMPGGVTSIGDRFVLGQGALRGFEFGGFGPRDLTADGAPALGGNRFAVARLDAQFPRLLKSDRVVPGLFLDAGSLWSLDDTALGGGNFVDDSARIRSSLGLSLSLQLGVGSVVMNLSQPLQSEDYDRTQPFQLAFQASF